MSNEVLKNLVASEGYCCVRGYLKQCAARGQSAEDMARYMGVAASTIRYNYERMRDGKRSHNCCGSPHCYEKENPESGVPL